jgi:hypothetical protein
MTALSLKNWKTHAIVFILLFAAWRFLERWYAFQGLPSYIFFGLFFVSALVVLLFPLIRSATGTAGKIGLLILGISAVLMFPYSEWLRLNANTWLQDWTRQLFVGCAFLYGIYLLTLLFPRVAEKVTDITGSVFHFAASRRSIYWLVPALYFILASYIANVTYGHTLLIEDSASYLFQAKIFSQHKFFAPVPPEPEFFSFYRDLLVMHDGRWFSMYPPGFSLLLVLPLSVGAQWFLSPLFGAATVALWMFYARRNHSGEVAFLLGILMLSSPFLLAMNSAIMIHTPELLIASALIVLLLAENGSASIGRCVAISILLCFAVLVRFFSIIAFVTPAFLYSLYVAWKKRSWAVLIFTLVGVISGFLLLGLYQWKTTGSPTVSGYDLSYKNMPGHHYGFGPAGEGIVHTPLRGLENTSDNFLGLNSWLSGWYSGSIFFFLSFFFLQKPQTKDRILLAGCFSLALFYFFYYFQDLSYGPRYFFVMSPVVLLIVARSTVAAGNSLARQVITVLMIVSLFSAIPFRIPAFIQRSAPNHREAGSVARAVNRLRPTKTILYLCEGTSKIFVTWNDPFLSSPVLICLDKGPLNHQLEAHFPNYQVRYFEPNRTPGLKGQTEPFEVYSNPSVPNPGYVNLYRLAMTIIAASDYPDRDMFDLCYADLFHNRDVAADQLAYFDELLNKPYEKSGYRDEFRKTILHAGKLMVLPLVARQLYGDRWLTKLATEDFRREFQTALELSGRSAEVGKPIAEQLNKVGQRIDRDHDGVFSDQEIMRYLSMK